jgi:hypothetical protein
MPEYELHRDELTTTAYERGRDPGRYDFDRVYAAAQAASDRSVPLAALRTRLSDADSLVRYWGATGVLIRGREAVVSASAELERLLSDSEPGPQLVAGEALARFGDASARQRAIDVLLEKSDAGRHEEYVATLALYSLNQVTDLPPAVTEAVAKLPAAPAPSANRLPQRQSVLERLIEAVARNVR